MPEERLSASLEDYLEAIFHVVEAKQASRAKDIADRLNVNSSSVTSALHALKERGLVNYEPYDLVTLTPEGLRIEAQTIPWDRGPEDPSQATSRMTGAPTGAPTGATVLHLGMIDTVTIPDADLPPDLTPDRLVALVQSWRSPCPPF